jgi:hypothetical protein
MCYKPAEFACVSARGEGPVQDPGTFVLFDSEEEYEEQEPHAVVDSHIQLEDHWLDQEELEETQPGLLWPPSHIQLGPSPTAPEVAAVMAMIENLNLVNPNINSVSQNIDVMINFINSINVAAMDSINTVDAIQAALEATDNVVVEEVEEGEEGTANGDLGLEEADS